jgi:hypothetical protein
MTRGPNNTVPMGLVLDPDRTDPGEPPSVSTSADNTEPGSWSPEVTPVTPSLKSPDNGTDPGLDPMLKAFNRPPRPPAPQPNLRSSSDGDEFAAHYASPRGLAAPQVGPTAHDPAVLVQLAQLARTDTAPMADPTPDGAIAVQRDVQTVVVRGEKRIPARTLLVALAVGALIATPAAFLFGRPSKSPTVVASTGAESANVQPLPAPPSAESPSPSSPSTSPSPVSPVPVPVTVATAAPTPPATVRSALPAAPPVAPPPTTRPTSSGSPRPPTSEHVKPPVPPRPPHENPDTVL